MTAGQTPEAYENRLNNTFWVGCGLPVMNWQTISTRLVVIFGMRYAGSC